MKKTRSDGYAWRIFFLCCCLSGAVSGMTIHCRGIFYAPAAQGLGVSATVYSTYTTLGSLGGILLMPFVTQTFNTRNIKKVLSTYLLVFCGADVLLGIANSMWQCYLIGMLQGTVSTFLSLYPIAYLLRNWFQKRRGLVTGLATMFAGLVASLMNMVLNWSISFVGWRMTYILVGVISFALAEIPILLFAVRKPSDIGCLPYGAEEECTEVSLKKEKAPFSFTILLAALPVIIMSSSCYLSTGYNQHLSNFALTLGLSSTFGASLISVCMIGNTASKLVIGTLNDLIGVYKTSFLTLFTMCVSMFVLSTGTNNALLLYPSALLLGQATAFIAVQVPLLLGAIYDDDTEYERGFSLVMMFGSLVGSLQNLLISWLYTKSNSYHSGHLMVSVILGLGLVMVLVLANRRKKVLAG